MTRTPLGRVGQPEELIGPVIFLASSMASYVNGVDPARRRRVPGGLKSPKSSASRRQAISRRIIDHGKHSKEKQQ